MARERVLIMGTGAMACWFAARLAPTLDVTMAGTWRAGLDALASGGVILEDSGSPKSYPVQVVDYTAGLPHFQFALVLVKAFQTHAAGQVLRRWLAPDGVALTLQNGLGNLEGLVGTLGEERAALGVTTVGATLVRPGHVRAGGNGPTRIARHPRTPPLVDLFRSAGLDAELADDALGLAWGKLVVNCAVNPITALLRIPNGGLLLPEASPAWGVACDAAAEAARVASVVGIRLPYAEPLAELERIVNRTAGNRSSMLQDVDGSRQTEVEAITGAVVARAEEHGVPVPVNRILLALVQGLPHSDGRGGA
jgi:2-dehydropantoate 2-reductase